MNSTSTSNLQTKPKITTLGADDATPKTITLEMVFWVENNSKFVRGKSRSLKDIEYWVFNDYDIQVTDKECGRYEITLCYTSYKSLDEQLDTIEMEASRIADSRHGFIEFDVFTIDGEQSWPFAGWDQIPSLTPLNFIGAYMPL